MYYIHFSIKIWVKIHFMGVVTFLFLNTLTKILGLEWKHYLF